MLPGCFEGVVRCEGLRGRGIFGKTGAVKSMSEGLPGAPGCGRLGLVTFYASRSFLRSSASLRVRDHCRSKGEGYGDA